MKTFRMIGFVLLAIIICLSACSGGGDDTIEPTPTPEVIKSEITIDSSIITNGLSFTSEKGEKSVSFSTNENWTLSVASTTSGATWCTPSATSGSKGNVSVKFSVAENTSYENRSVSVTIKSGSVTKTFVVLQEGAEKAIPYVTFIADAEQTLRMSKAVETLEYSVNGKEWKELGTNTIEFGGEIGDLRLRGMSAIGTAVSIDFGEYSHISFETKAKVSCTGDIRTLINYKNPSAADTSNAKFIRLFHGCTSLTSVPELPATTLAEHCYYSMFFNCTSLTSAPKLPATTLADCCYQGMFQGCISLTSAPELPATALADHCYQGMFFDCTSLASAPELPATTLTDYCYYTMFLGCTSLTSAPELPATNLADYCFRCMFYDCISLTSAPELPATTLADHCYSGMFIGCTSMTSAPELPATILTVSCYNEMFSGCTNLTSAPKLPATTLADYCYQRMFYGCTSLTSAPELPATTLTRSCYSNMFVNCTNLSSVTMLATDISASFCLYRWLDGVSKIGTFIKAKGIETSILKDAVAIPNGWTVID